MRSLQEEGTLSLPHKDHLPLGRRDPVEISLSSWRASIKYNKKIARMIKIDPVLGTQEVNFYWRRYNISDLESMSWIIEALTARVVGWVHVRSGFPEEQTYSGDLELDGEFIKQGLGGRPAVQPEGTTVRGEAHWQGGCFDRTALEPQGREGPAWSQFGKVV